MRVLRTVGASAAAVLATIGLAACTSSTPSPGGSTIAPGTPSSSVPSSSTSSGPALSAGATAALAALRAYDVYTAKVLTDPASYSNAAAQQVAVSPALTSLQGASTALESSHQAFRGTPLVPDYTVTKDQSTATTVTPVVTFSACIGASPLKLYDTQTNQPVPTSAPTGVAPYPWPTTVQVVKISASHWAVATYSSDSKHTCTP